MDNLFEIVPIVSFKNESPQKNGWRMIQCAAQGGFKGYEFFAMYLSTNYLVIRSTKTSRTPLFRTFRFYPQRVV